MNIHLALTKLIIRFPFYSNLISRLIIKESRNIKLEIDVFPYYVLRYNPTWFGELEEDSKIGVILHELLHIVLLHPYRRGNRDKNLWSISCDIAVNQYIEPRFLPPNSVTLEAFKKIIPNMIEFRSSEEYYSQIENILSNLNLEVTGKEGLIEIDGVIQLRFDVLDDKKNLENKLGDLKEVLGESLILLDSNQKIERELKDSGSRIYSDYTLDWRNILKRFLSTLGKVNKRKSYKRISRRFDYLPGTRHTKGIKALVALDESASMSDELIKIYLTELKRINRVTGVDISVVRFDTTCSNPIPLREYIEEKGRKRKGGTDFRPIFDLASRLKFPSIIIFTDGDGEAPENAGQKVLWLLTKGGKNPSNYGEVVYFTG